MSFTEIYKENCLKRNEEQLDEVYTWICQQDHSEHYKYALSDQRLCIAIPAEAAQKIYALPPGYYEHITDDGQKVYMDDLLHSGHRSIILEKLYEPECSIELLRWKIRRHQFRVGSIQSTI